MTLDSWLRKRAASSARTIEPKKPKLDHGDDVGGPVRPHKPTPAALQEVREPARMSAAQRNARSYFRLPAESRYGRRSLYQWSPSGYLDCGDHVTSLSCMSQAPVAILGLDSGSVQLVGTGSRGDLNSFGATATEIAVPPNWPIVDINERDSHTLVCASKKGVSAIDVESCSIRSFVSHDDDEITHIATHNRTTVASGSNGSIRLLDDRMSEFVPRRIGDAHSILKGPLAGRQRPSISALSWAGPHTVATGAQNSESVKFWDIRYMRKTPIVTTWQKSGPAKNMGGINSICSREDGYVWALTRRGILLKLSEYTEEPLCRLQAPQLKVSSPNQSLDIVTAERTSDGGPSYPLLASCSDAGVLLVTEPSREALQQHVDSTFASCLPLQSFASSVKWHPYSQSLICVTANRDLNLWTPNRSTAPLKPARIRMTSIRRPR